MKRRPAPEKPKRKPTFTAADLGLILPKPERPKRPPKYRDALDFRLPGSFENGKRR